jgi:hypothetical protein
MDRPADRSEGGVSTALIAINTLGAEIKARIDAGDKALAKAEDHYLAAGIQLVEARRRVSEDGGSFKAFLVQHGIGRSKAYDILAVTDGKKTFDGIRAKGAERAARHAEAGRIARESVSNGLGAVALLTEVESQFEMLKQAWEGATKAVRRKFMAWAKLESVDDGASIQFARLCFDIIPADEIEDFIALSERAYWPLAMAHLKRLSEDAIATTATPDTLAPIARTPTRSLDDEAA